MLNSRLPIATKLATSTPTNQRVSVLRRRLSAAISCRTSERLRSTLSIRFSIESNRRSNCSAMPSNRPIRRSWSCACVTGCSVHGGSFLVAACGSGIVISRVLRRCIVVSTTRSHGKDEVERYFYYTTDNRHYREYKIISGGSSNVESITASATGSASLVPARWRFAFQPTSA